MSHTDPEGGIGMIAVTLHGGRKIRSSRGLHLAVHGAHGRACSKYVNAAIAMKAMSHTLHPLVLLHSAPGYETQFSTA